MEEKTKNNIIYLTAYYPSIVLYLIGMFADGLPVVFFVAFVIGLIFDLCFSMFSIGQYVENSFGEHMPLLPIVVFHPIAILSLFIAFIDTDIMDMNWIIYLILLIFKIVDMAVMKHGNRI